MTRLRILTYRGIGDFSWCYSKLVSLGRPLEVWFKHPGGDLDKLSVHNRLRPFLRMLPLVQSSRGHAVREHLLKQPPLPLAQLRTVAQTHFAVNAHLEQGKRIEEYVPELATDFHYPLKQDVEEQQQAHQLLAGRTDYLLFYVSAKGNAANWRGWKPSEWAAFARLFRQAYGPVPVVITGATWDQAVAAETARAVSDAINLVGKTSLPATVELIRRAKYFVAFPSGLGVLANVVRTPVLMFYPAHLEAMINTWADPVDIASGAYQGSLWCSPEEAMSRVSGYLKS